jgi:hypothetical protein
VSILPAPADIVGRSTANFYYMKPRQKRPARAATTWWCVLEFVWASRWSAQILLAVLVGHPFSCRPTEEANRSGYSARSAA